MKTMASNISSEEHDEAQEQLQPASISEVFSFASRKTRVFMWMAVVFAVLCGCILPVLSFFLTRALADLGASVESPDFMDDVRQQAFNFMILGGVSFFTYSAMTFLFGQVATEMTLSLRTQWFEALLRQDMAYHEVYDVSGSASVIATQSLKFHRGLGKKLGVGILYVTTFVTGLGFSFVSSWRASLVILACMPVIAASVLFLAKVNSTKFAKATQWYADAASVVSVAVAAIRTILSLNAVPRMIADFEAATGRACVSAIGYLKRVGLANGVAMGSFLLTYIAVALYGGYLLGDNIMSSGCDPSTVVDSVETCDPSGPDIAAALFTITLSAAGLPQVSLAIEAFEETRAACAPALHAINRTLENSDGYEELPKYAIDSSSPQGHKPDKIEGNIELKDVRFAYPTRSHDIVFDSFSLKIPAGKTVALVGPSGSGKSTTVQLVSRFYDPMEGSVSLDGIDLKDINVKWLREHVGVVRQEPKLFATTIAENIAGGREATRDEIVQAAKNANAHDFIQSFPNGYETQVGDKGTQLSGGQKQRIAIARVLLRDPKILLLDEATSALDSQSEKVVQSALDKLLEKGNRTTIVIAHRLSTIRDADMIAVVADGKVVETGTHNELLFAKGHYYELVHAQEVPQFEEEATKMITATDDMEIIEEEDTSTTLLYFSNVRFAYPARPEQEIFHGLNLSIKEGETLALVGPSGGGKSTTIQLIERFYLPTSGKVEFEGLSVDRFDIRWLRDQMGLVGQEPTLFDMTIGENIRFGFPNATQEQVVEAAKQANAHDFIVSFPDGYDTMVGEGGAKVSGGQKQRIAIARALVKNPRILLLDEATSALDTESERVVQEALDKLMSSKDRTTIVIAHRLSTIRNADRIAVISDGRVREIGTHTMLMRNPKGLYRQLNKHQSLVKTDDDAQEDRPPHSARKPFLRRSSSVLQEGGMSRLGASLKSISIKSMRGSMLLPQDLKFSMKMPKEMSRKKQKSEDGTDKDDRIEVSRRSWDIAKEELKLFLFGGMGAFLTGLLFPAWGMILAFLVEMLNTPVLPCEDGVFVPENFATCDDYFTSIGDGMRERANQIAYGCLGAIGMSILGNLMIFTGIDAASERTNKRVRDQAFSSLMRQEVAYFDSNDVSALKARLEEDAAMIQAFIGEPIRSAATHVSSLVVGLAICFVFMWPLAILSLLLVPAIVAINSAEFGERHDEGVTEDESPSGAVVVEALQNIRTIASLALEEKWTADYVEALRQEDPKPVRTNLLKGLVQGTSELTKMFGFALLFWFGGWVLIGFSDTFTYTDFLLSFLVLVFAMLGSATAASGLSNRNEVSAAAERVFALLDRESKIDPLPTGSVKRLHLEEVVVVSEGKG